MPVALQFLSSWRIVTVQETKNRGDEQQGCQRRAQKAADDGAAERRILLASVAEAERHGNHPNDHRESGHQHWPKARDAGLDGCLRGISMVLQPFGCEGHHENAV